MLSISSIRVIRVIRDQNQKAPTPSRAGAFLVHIYLFSILNASAMT